MSIMSYNGSAVLAMTGKNCVAIATDTRYGIRQQTLASNMPKVFQMSDKVFVGLTGLLSDIQTLHERLVFRLNLYRLKEEREMKPSVFAHLVSTLLYEKRFGPYFVEPIIAGLEGPDNKPFISSTDLIGAPLLTNDFVVGGTPDEALLGMCESLYKPDMDPEELFETISQCLLAAVDRDAFSGWGAVVHVITPTGVITRKLKVRQD
eukprot:TRINITY_DN643_c0_g1_i1.p1 TRINITY_DN643_c0_g1~~TRINITY_DN643_c0_g1_i1.p1  ORF type:complete len:206 (-),score=69.39 TRINITY_DN643_c0_g1_i1:170-787(-)